MRKWGVVISVFYAVIVLAILMPAAFPLAGGSGFPSEGYFGELGDLYAVWQLWVPTIAVLASQAILLFLSVDTSFKKLRPKAHIAISVAIASLLFGLLATAAFYCVWVAVRSDSFGSGFLGDARGMFSVWGALWVLWGIVFYFNFRNSQNAAARTVSWLLKGSVLELLIAVPCHVWVRRRGDCSAPAYTSFGIVTGIAVMLLAFGPSVLLLYKKRLDAYAGRKSA